MVVLVPWSTKASSHCHLCYFAHRRRWAATNVPNQEKPRPTVTLVVVAAIGRRMTLTYLGELVQRLWLQASDPRRNPLSHYRNDTSSRSRPQSCHALWFRLDSLAAGWSQADDCYLMAILMLLWGATMQWKKRDLCADVRQKLRTRSKGNYHLPVAFVAVRGKINGSFNRIVGVYNRYSKLS